MTWSELDWPALDRLRARFLSNSNPAGPYWASTEELGSYDFTYAERIGWKWDHVLRELRLRGWRPGALADCANVRTIGRTSQRTVFDWGCGSGIAARRVIDFFGAQEFDELLLWDHSPLACDFAAEAAQRTFPGLRISQATSGFLSSDAPIGLLLVSHVLNELSPEAFTALRSLIGRADAMLWVESGTRNVSRALGQIRDELRATFRIVAPCTHALGCPMFAPENERHWCHFFAPPPTEIFANSDWVKFGQRAGIDLRSLPYAFIAMEKTPRGESVTPEDPALSRVIGRVEHFKPYARWLNCDASGLAELELPKRAAPALFKELERTKAPLVYRWQREGNKVLGGEPFPA